MTRTAGKKEFQQGVLDALPTGLGYLSIGIAFGVVAAGAGLSVWVVGLMSLLIYGGSAQFAFVSLVAAGDPVYAIVLTVGLVNLRNMLMSLHATTYFEGAPLRHGLAIGSLITDESYGVLLGKVLAGEPVSLAWMHGNNLFSYGIWVTSTMLGALLGSLLPNPELLGLDFALLAMFVGLFSSQLLAMRQTNPHLKWFWILAAVGIGYILCSMVLSSSLAVLLATLLGCGMGVILSDETD